MWNKVKAELRKKISDQSYKLWIEPINLVSFNGKKVEVACSNFFARKHVLKNYGDLIKSAIENVTGKNRKLVITSVYDKGKKATRKITGKYFQQSPPPKKQLSLPHVSAWHQTARLLNNNYTFRNFVVADNNDFAFSAALSLASKKKSNQNTLFLLSKIGMGKTHLAQAMGHHISSHYPSDRVFYITAEDFANEMAYAFQSNTIAIFNEKYRNQCDVLILEDIHFLSGKDRTQNELAAALDYMFELNKKIIFTSCYLPRDIPKMNDQLNSRFSSCLISKIDAPSFKTRVKILKKKSTANGYTIPDDINDYLACELTENVRQLESGLNGVVAKSFLLGAPIDHYLAESVVKNITRKRETITIDLIKELVCRYYKISVDDIISRSRKQSVVRPRQVAIYLTRKFTEQPLQEIGKSFNRYHATALHSISAIERGLKENIPIQKQVAFLSKKIESGKL